MTGEIAGLGGPSISRIVPVFPVTSAFEGLLNARVQDIISEGGRICSRREQEDQRPVDTYYFMSISGDQWRCGCRYSW